MQLNSSLITGSTALFGIKTDMQFGKLKVSAITTAGIPIANRQLQGRFAVYPL